MSRKKRAPRERERLAPAEPRPEPRARRRSPVLWAALVLVLAAALLLRQRATAAATRVPDPVTSEMLAPARRALVAAREAVLAAPGSAGAWGEFAEVCDAHHLYPEAELAYREARARDPREFRWAYGLAVVRDFLGAEGKEIAALFEAAIRLQPRYPPARLRCGDALVRQGRLADARAAYEQALELDPDFAMAHRNLGQTLLALEDTTGAIARLERAAALDPSDAVVTSSLAQAYRRAGNEERATRAAEAARAKTPVYGVPDPVRFALEEKNVTPLACDRRARGREQRGEWSAALADLERLVEMDTAEMDAGDAALHWRLGRCLRALGQGERARSEFARALELAPDHLGALAEGAALAEEAGELARAAELYRRVTALAPENPLFWKRLGACLGPLGDLPGALAAFERAGAVSAPDAELLHNWGTALARAGLQSEACKRLLAALALEPGNAATHFSLAASLALLGRRDEAITHYEQAQALDQRLPVAEPLTALRAGR